MIFYPRHTVIKRCNQNIPNMLVFINKPAMSLLRKARRHQLKLIIKHWQRISPYLLLYFWPTVDQKRSVTFIEAQREPAGVPADTLPATGQPQGCSPDPPRKPEGMDKPVLTSSPAIVIADLHSLSPKQVRVLKKQTRLAPCLPMSGNHLDMQIYPI